MRGHFAASDGPGSIGTIARTTAPGPPSSARCAARDHSESDKIPLTRPRPLAEAISTAGGIRFTALDDTLMLRQLPGVFVAGEMLDWEAPTGGYLLTGCFATATRAAKAALNWPPK